MTRSAIERDVKKDSCGGSEGGWRMRSVGSMRVAFGSFVPSSDLQSGDSGNSWVGRYVPRSLYF